ncbi:MAG TPA: IS110 family transposase [Ferruginibacter sp.]|jgi:transposase|nr:IS110 family transposase [Ferruginibacter sp.]
MTQVKKLDFRGTTIFCGVDVHKKNWRVNIQDSEFELEDFSQNAEVVLLHKHLKGKYPGAKFKVCYEAGFSGFSAQRWLSEQGVECQVVNASDVATSDKEKRQKNDKVDARKLCEHLQSKKMKGIYIPALHWEHGRSLVRARSRIVSNQTRCKNRIWQLLHFSGLALPKGYEAGQYWSSRFIKELQATDCGSEELKTTLSLYIKDYQQTRTLLLEATRAIRKLCKQPVYEKDILFLRSIPGIGEIIAAIILFELQEVSRFKHFDHLCSYAGLVPNTSDSGETKRTKGITNRSNYNLRTALVESSWIVIRKDPSMLMKYKKYCRKMEKNKAIIRIAKHLLSRINYVLKNKKEYVIGVLA